MHMGLSSTILRTVAFGFTVTGLEPEVSLPDSTQTVNTKSRAEIDTTPSCRVPPLASRLLVLLYTC